MSDETITEDEAIAAIERCKFVCGDDEISDHTGKPRELVHCFLGFLGADWDTYSAIEEVKHADRVYWGDTMFGDCLVVESTWSKYDWDEPGKARRYVFDTVTKP